VFIIKGAALTEHMLTLLQRDAVHGVSVYHQKSRVPNGFCCWLQNALSGTPTKFDGGYYAEVIAVNGLKGQFGWFASDMHGFCNTFKAKSGTTSPNVVGRKLKQVRPCCSPSAVQL
jgi:hypothetical protein